MVTVLVIEDDQLIRESLSAVLESEGFSVALAGHGEEGLSWLRSHTEQACAVLLDLMMPVMDGFEFLRRKQDDPAIAAVPVIVITAAGPIVEKRLRQNHRVHECLAKPLNLDHLLAAVDSSCGLMREDAAPVVSDRRDDN